MLVSEERRSPPNGEHFARAGGDDKAAISFQSIKSFFLGALSLSRSTFISHNAHCYGEQRRRRRGDLLYRERDDRRRGLNQWTQRSVRTAAAGKEAGPSMGEHARIYIPVPQRIALLALSFSSLSRSDDEKFDASPRAMRRASHFLARLVNKSNAMRVVPALIGESLNFFEIQTQIGTRLGSSRIGCASKIFGSTPFFPASNDDAILSILRHLARGKDLEKVSHPLSTRGKSVSRNGKRRIGVN